ncbi:hypothetical protein CVS29_01275 [Arthrobacter psychrochitiniphilus]|uniref:Uncharacterized protein n=1 Tax=Arthrobacter psychrochitiniphilus TaxID=291045 RepID=A0A2V3DV99_9MICC|nr:hypothetical protein CVS29_01275 [Arthrobacter psychrochitiniphilus]
MLVFGLSILQPVKEATPDEAARVVAAQAKDAPFVSVRNKFTTAVLVVTVFPPASWMLTVGWAAKGTPPVEVGEGWEVKPSLLAGPTRMVKLALVALVRPVDAAVNV